MINECLEGKIGRKIYRTDDFYENGGDSQDTFLLLSKLEEEFQIEISPDVIYMLKTGEKIADYIKEKNQRIGSNACGCQKKKHGE